MKTFIIAMSLMLILVGTLGYLGATAEISKQENLGAMGRYGFDSDWSSTLGWQGYYMPDMMKQEYQMVAKSIEVDNIIWNQKRGIPF